MSALARLSLANRAIVMLGAIAVIVFGVVGVFSVRQELMPSIAMPTITVTTMDPGASAAIVERDVTDPIESALGGLDGLQTRTSTTSDGLSTVQAELDYGTDLDKAVGDAERAIDQIPGGLPDGVQPPVVRKSGTDDSPVIVLAASSGAGEATLAKRLTDRAVPKLTSLDGVQDVQVTGQRDQQILVSVDTDELAGAHLSMKDVEQALKSNGVTVPGGDYDSGGTTLAVETGAAYGSADDVRNLEIPPPAQAGRPGTSASPVKLSDVATVTTRYAPATTITHTNGRRTLGVSVTKTPDGSTVSVSDEVKDAIGGIERDLGDGARLTVVSDQAPSITDAVKGLGTEGAVGLALAVVVILVFLLSLRSTLVTVVSIPLSLLIGVLGVLGFGYSLNIVTLGALTVAVGRVVDDAIVVLENIKRHLGYGEPRRDAILGAVREVAGAVTASTLTTVAVFLPIAFVGGIAGEMFRPFALTVTVALLASLLVALTVIPVLAYWFLPARTAAEPDRIREAALERERRSVLQRAYVPVARFATRHTVVTVLAGVAVLAGTVAMLPRLQTDFLPPFGQDTYRITETMPAGTSLDATDAAAGKVAGVLRGMPEVRTYQYTAGSSTGPRGQTSAADANTAGFTVTVASGTDSEDFQAKLRGRLAALRGAGELDVAGGTSMESDDLQVTVYGADDATLRTAAGMVSTAMRGTPDVADVADNLAVDRPTVQVRLDRTEAARHGLSDAQVGQAVQQALNGAKTTTVSSGDTDTDVYVREGSAPDSLDAIRDLDLPSATGGTVKLSEVADVSRVSRPAQVTHTDGDRTATVTGRATGADVGTVSKDLTKRLDALHLPSGARYEVGGVSQMQTDAFQQLSIALGAAIVLVFAVMVAAFRRIAQALILLVSIPFAATGGIGLMLLTGTPLGLPGLIGLLMLVGIVVTNAIVLIDLINQYRWRGMSVRDAVVHGGRRRLRPILMTAVATICALIPMAVGLTSSSGFISQPLAIVVIGGLVSSTLLTLVLVPALYTIVEGVRERRRPRDPDPVPDVRAPAPML